MNYFELYPGDYLKATQRLTLLEHGAYLRLLMAYYGEEEPLPADLGELYIVVGAISSSDKAAVRKVADRFFPVAADGLRHNGRADEEIAKAQKRIATAKANGAKGGRKPKAEPNPEETQRVTQRATQPLTQSGEALHTPHAMHHQEASGRAQEIPQGPGTAAGLACRLMREVGCGGTNPSHPNLLAALAEGVTPETLADTAREAIAAGVQKPFAYAITTARGRHAEGARPVITGPPRVITPPQPSLRAQGVAAILGVNAHDLVAQFASGPVVQEPDRNLPCESVPAEPGRLSGV